MEAHEGILVCIVVFAFDLTFVHISRHGIVDIQKRNGILADNSSQVFAQSSPDIHFTGYRNTASCQTAVHIAGNESELGLECRPAFCCEGHIFSASSVSLNPVKQCDLVLCQFRQDFRFHVAFTKLALHIFYNIRDTRVICMVLVALKQV